MPDLRSGKLSPEVESYFDNLVKRLASKDDIQSLKELIEEQNTAIIKLNKRVNDQENVITSLESKIENLEGEVLSIKKQNNLSERKNDDLEQYGRRTSLRIDGLEVSEKETASECESKVKSYISEVLELEIDENDYDRVHRIGKKMEEGGKFFQQTIVKFKSFSPRTKVYRSRPRSGGIKIKLDLTKRRYKLLGLAYDKCKNNKDVKFVFADINCSLCIHFENGLWKFFNSIEELENLLKEVSGQ